MCVTVLDTTQISAIIDTMEIKETLTVDVVVQEAFTTNKVVEQHIRGHHEVEKKFIN